MHSSCSPGFRSNREKAHPGFEPVLEQALVSGPWPREPTTIRFACRSFATAAIIDAASPSKNLRVVENPLLLGDPFRVIECFPSFCELTRQLRLVLGLADADPGTHSDEDRLGIDFGGEGNTLTNGCPRAFRTVGCDQDSFHA
jgi:hypothetical protein